MADEKKPPVKPTAPAKDEDVQTVPAPQPPGSASNAEKGTLQNTVNEQRLRDEASSGAQQTGSQTQSASGKGAAFAPDEEDVQNVRLITTTPESEDARARREAIAGANAQKAKEAQEKTQKQSEQSLSPALLTLLAQAREADPRLAAEIDQLTAGADEAALHQAQADARNTPAPDGILRDQPTKSRLQSMLLPPGADKPIEFETAPGVDPEAIDTRYWPTRYKTRPADKSFEQGDLVYRVHEDSTFFVLSKEQQTKQWQASHHLPTVTLMAEVGGGAGAPKQPKVAAAK